MVIERTIASKVGEYGSVAICDERTVRIELTDDEIEEAYRIREGEYLEEDIRNANLDIIHKITNLYEKNQDVNVASADTMKEAVKQVLKEEGVWK
mgnify:CR=1 FL=1